MHLQNIKKLHFYIEVKTITLDDRNTITKNMLINVFSNPWLFHYGSRGIISLDLSSQSDDDVL